MPCWKGNNVLGLGSWVVVTMETIQTNILRDDINLIIHYYYSPYKVLKYYRYGFFHKLQNYWKGKDECLKYSEAKNPQ